MGYELNAKSASPGVEEAEEGKTTKGRDRLTSIAIKRNVHPAIT